jgi:hypothetical protein
MSCDKLVFDLSQEVEGSPNVFVRKDWLNILDNQNQNYQNNQSIIDTSQLSNSNKYMAYREAYLAVPLLLTMACPNVGAAGAGDLVTLAPLNNGGPPAVSTQCYADYSIGLKNWFGQIIHSFTLDYNGTTIIQQTPFCNMWNSFKLMTTLSYNDILTQGPTIGFYPDTTSAFAYVPSDVVQTTGRFLCNNDLAYVENSFSGFKSSVGNRYAGSNNNQYQVLNGGNYGLTKRISWINYNTAGASGIGIAADTNVVPLNINSYISTANISQIWKSYISRQSNSGVGANAIPGVMQISVMATIYLKHIHSFFNMVPLLKGAFVKMTMNLNNSTATINLTNTPTADVACTVATYTSNTFVGGISPLLIPSGKTGSYNAWKATGVARSVYYNISVGSRITDGTITGLANIPQQLEGQVAKSIYLYVPAYTFNPTFEQAYLSVSPKIIKYTDIYQYQVLNVLAGNQFNNLITNGIANIKSVLIIPFFANEENAQGTAGVAYSQFLSPFDPAGSTSTAPIVNFGNFNVQISGQNAIYNMQRYGFEEFNNQLYGQFAVNGGLTDGLTSGLIDFNSFQNSQSYYYVNVERMLPVEQSVPKSVQILGSNFSASNLNLWVFIEYGVQVSIDILTGARV